MPFDEEFDEFLEDDENIVEQADDGDQVDETSPEPTKIDDDVDPEDKIASLDTQGRGYDRYDDQK